MGEKGQTAGSRKKLAVILGVIGIILVIAGVAIATIHSALRGSGLGTLSLVAGIVLLVIAILMYTRKLA